ncbi:MAG: YezD family protein [Gemmatimonadales bacterium]
MATDLAQQTQSTSSLPVTALTPALLEELYLALSTIRFGTIELVIHDGRVVQLEKREKVRFQTEVTHARR